MLRAEAFKAHNSSMMSLGAWNVLATRAPMSLSAQSLSTAHREPVRLRCSSASVVGKEPVKTHPVPVVPELVDRPYMQRKVCQRSEWSQWPRTDRWREGIMHL